MSLIAYMPTEHMLFLGTRKYPQESEYTQFLTEHGGSSNAFTSGRARMACNTCSG